MYSIDNVNAADSYTDAATLGPVFRSAGGFCTVSGHDAFCQLGYVHPNPQGGGQGQWTWDDEFHIPVGAAGTILTLLPGTVAIRFRNYVAGSVAVVSASLNQPGRPSVQVAASGFASASVSSTSITGQIPAAGTTPTAGTGFTYTHGSTGVYVFTFTTAFAAAPTVLATIAGATTGFVFVASVSPGGMTINTFNVGSPPVAADRAFNFVAFTTV